MGGVVLLLSPRVRELYDSVRLLEEYCRTWLPIADEPVLPGTPGPSWIMGLVVLSSRYVEALAKVLGENDLLLRENRRPQFASGLDRFIRVYDGMLSRWG